MVIPAMKSHVRGTDVQYSCTGGRVKVGMGDGRAVGGRWEPVAKSGAGGGGLSQNVPQPSLPLPPLPLPHPPPLQPTSTPAPPSPRPGSWCRT